MVSAAAGGVRADDAWTPRPAISEKNVTTLAAGNPPPRDTESFAIVSDGWKLIHNLRASVPRVARRIYEDPSLAPPDGLARMAGVHTGFSFK